MAISSLFHTFLVVQDGCGARLVLQTPSREQMEYAIRIGFKVTTNEAKYEALLTSLTVATELKVESLDLCSDSQLVIKDFKIYQISKEENKKVDALANLASAFDFISDRSVPLEFLPNPSTDIAKTIYQATTNPTWMDDIIVTTLEMSPTKGIKLLLGKIYEGIFKNHSRARSLVRKAVRQGPWPFAQWGIDVLGPLPQAPLQRKFLIVSIDYFTKWVEGEPLAKITKRNTKNFVWKNIICRFRILKFIVFDNAKQFNNDGFKLNVWTLPSPTISPCQVILKFSRMLSMGSHIANPDLFHFARHSKDEMTLRLHLHQFSYICGIVSIWNPPPFTPKSMATPSILGCPDDYAVIFSHGCRFSIYKWPLTIHQKEIIAFSLSEP
ncbi:hypothetical protein Acr_22g0007500 [Actinidia rufa]|uniref:Integrase catalytic domain-containing protein n=1 Tax=Actinidia rufa TaxID=165716 RepID=A0A7J0GKQ5_9ERIC|nr:hypothetical protein Acr_22g0007500 [Actinidia rufa]